MNYQDPQTPMQIVSGKAVKLETVRYFVGSVLIGGFFGALLGIALGLSKEKSAWAVTEISGYDRDSGE